MFLKGTSSADNHSYSLPVFSFTTVTTLMDLKYLETGVKVVTVCHFYLQPDWQVAGIAQKQGWGRRECSIAPWNLFLMPVTRHYAIELYSEVVQVIVTYWHGTTPSQQLLLRQLVSCLKTLHPAHITKSGLPLNKESNWW